MRIFPGLLSWGDRLGRLPFALRMLVVTLVAYAAPLRWLVDMAIHSIDPDYPLENIPLARDAPVLPAGLAGVILALAAMLALALAWTSLSAFARRFHDLGLTAWLVLPALGLALLMPGVVPAGFPPLGPLLLIVVMSLVPGTQAANHFGESASTGT